MQNIVTLSGRLVADPEPISDKGHRGRLAFSTGQNKTPSGFINVTAWGEVGVELAKHSKGAEVLVEGALGFDQWESKDGGKRQQVTINAERVRA